MAYNNDIACMCSLCTPIPNVCLHLSLAPRCPWPCITTKDEMELPKKRKLVQQTTKISRKRTKKAYWEMKKELTESDTFGVTCRLLIGKKLAEGLVVPVLGADAKKGIEVKICDVDTNNMYYLTFKKFNSGSYGFNGNWNQDFVARRGLKSGDVIGLHWDRYNKCFDFSVLEVNQDGRHHCCLIY